jgi:hypothetical protein
MAMLPTMLEDDRRQAGWSVSQAGWRLGVSVREYWSIDDSAAFKTSRAHHETGC